MKHRARLDADQVAYPRPHRIFIHEPTRVFHRACTAFIAPDKTNREYPVGAGSTYSGGFFLSTASAASNAAIISESRSTARSTESPAAVSPHPRLYAAMPPLIGYVSTPLTTVTTLTAQSVPQVGFPAQTSCSQTSLLTGASFLFLIRL